MASRLLIATAAALALFSATACGGSSGQSSSSAGASKASGVAGSSSSSAGGDSAPPSGVTPNMLTISAFDAAGRDSETKNGYCQQLLGIDHVNGVTWDSITSKLGANHATTAQEISGGITTTGLVICDFSSDATVDEEIRFAKASNAAISQPYPHLTEHGVTVWANIKDTTANQAAIHDLMRRVAWEVMPN